MKVQLVLLTVFCAIFSEAGPLAEVKETLSDRGDINRGLDKLVPAVQFGYRLPNNSIPLRYDLWLRTDVDKEIFDFSGRVKIHVKIIEATQQITLHYRQITIDNIDLYDVDQSLIDSNLQFELNESFELLLISLPQVVSANEEIILDIKYNGELRNDKAGFFRGNYLRDESVVWFATTQFHTTHARHALPCYDEPSFLASFQVEIQHDNSYDAVSNMPLVTREPVGGSSHVTSKFEATPPMSTYMLSFMISDFDFISNNSTEVEQRIYALPQSISRGDGDFASSVVDAIRKGFEEHLGVEYPLTKMDHIAIGLDEEVDPDVIVIKPFGSDSRENVGVSTYEEMYLLHFQGTSEVYKKLITETIAHEWSHQWFGGYVAPAWWSYAWLNDGFAALFQYIIPSLVFDDTYYDENFEIAMQIAFMADTIASDSKPLNFYVESPNEIESKFSYISNQKGSAVLRMFREVMTPPTFAKGVRYYLTAMKHSFVTPSDLHRELQRAFDEDFPENNYNLDEVMATWEDQAGYPNIHVEQAGDKFILTQSRYYGGDEIYAIPVSYATKHEPTFDVRTPKMLMTTDETEIQSSYYAADWIILNIYSTGFYKVTYDTNIWLAFIEQLKTDHEVIPPFHRTILFVDLNNILSYPYNTFGYVSVLEMLSYLGSESESSVWYRAAQVSFSYELFGTTAYPKYQEFHRSLVKPHLDRLGFEKIDGESANDARLRTLTADVACDALQTDCLMFELKKLEAFLEYEGNEYRMCYGLRLADSTLHNVFVERLFASDDFVYERADYLEGLGCSLDRNVLKSYLEIMLNTTNNLNNEERTKVISYTAYKSVAALEVSLDFMIEHYKEIIEILPGKFNTLLRGTLSALNSLEHIAKLNIIVDLLKETEELDEEDVLFFTMRTDENMQWIQKNFYDVDSWLTRQNSNN